MNACLRALATSGKSTVHGSFASTVFDAAALKIDLHQTSPPAIFVSAAFLGITGILAPQSLCFADSHGVISRFLLAEPAPPGPPSARASFAKSIRVAWHNLLMDLLAIRYEPAKGLNVLRFTAAAMEVYVTAHDRLHGQAASLNDPLLRAHLENLVSYIPRLALVIQVMKNPRRRRRRVSRRSAEAAVEIVHYFTVEIERIHGVRRNPQSEEIAYLLEIVELHHGQITPRQLMHASHRFRRSVDQAKAALQRLVDQGLGEMVWLKGPRDPVLTFRLFNRNGNNSGPGATKNEEGVTSP